MRLRTLPLSLAGVVLGVLLAGAGHCVDALTVVLLLLTTVSLQVLSNLSNELGDTLSGTDRADRQGIRYSLQDGEMSIPQMKRLILFAAVWSACCGLAMVYSAFGTLRAPLPLAFLVLGAAAIWAAMHYTLGKRPYGYRGLGDFYCFLFFGWAAVAGTFYLATKSLDFSVLLPASAMGFLSNAVLNINNMRDYENDKTSGKNSLVVKLGLEKAFVYHCLLIGGVFVCLTVYLILHHAAWYSYLFWLLSLLFIKDLISIRKTQPERIDPFLGRQVKHSFLLVLVYGILVLMGT